RVGDAPARGGAAAARPPRRGRRAGARAPPPRAHRALGAVDAGRRAALRGGRAVRHRAARGRSPRRRAGRASRPRPRADRRDRAAGRRGRPRGTAWRRARRRRARLRGLGAAGRALPRRPAGADRAARRGLARAADLRRPGLARWNRERAAPMKETMRQVLRALSTVLIVSGTLLIADAAATVTWQEPLSALLGRLSQDKLSGQLDRLESVGLTPVERRVVRSLPDPRRRIAFLARSLKRRAAD